MMLIILCVLWLSRNILKRHWVTGSLIFCIGLGAVGRFVVPLFFSSDFLSMPLPDSSVFNVSPTTHLATFSFGALAGYQKGQWKKAILAAIALYSLMGIVPFGVYDTLFIVAAAFFVLFIPTLMVPKLLGAALYKIAGASLFIYLWHLPIYRVLGTRLGLPVTLCFFAAILVGYGCWVGWNWCVQNAGRTLAVRWEGQWLRRQAARGG
jgi:hypothetical protein